MRILMTTDTVGGVWTYSLELAAALAPLGVEVELATMGAAPDAAQRHAAGRVPNLGLHTSTFALEWMPEPWSDVDLAGEWLLELERELQPDVIHLNGYCHGALPFRAPRIVVGHSCVLSWWRAVRGTEAPAEWNTYRRRVTAGLHAAEHVTAPSAAMLQCLIDHYGALGSCEVIYNARAPEAFSPSTKLPAICSAGRLWDEAKNLGTLERAAARIPWPVYVAGDTGRAGAAHCELAANVTWVGRLSAQQLAARLAFAAIYVLPARYEPFGLSILEAALAGCALIVGDIPSLREIWGDAAIFVPPEDDDALVRAACELIESPLRRRELAARARHRALTFTPQRMADAYLRRYRLLTGRASRSITPAGPTATIDSDTLTENPLTCAS